MPEPLPYPERLGRWPAVAGIVFFGVCELCWAGGREPQTLALLGLAYLVAALVGMSLYGVEPWTRHADPFGAYFSLFARLAPLTRRDGRAVRARRRAPARSASTPCRARPRCCSRRSASPRSTAAARAALQRRRAAPAGLLREPGREQGHGARAGVRRRPRVHGAVRLGDLLGRDRRDEPARAAAADDAHRARALAGAHARADRRRLRRRALLLAARLQRPGPLAPRLGPAGGRQRPVRRRRLAASTTPSSPRRRSGTSRSPRSSSAT